jgi:GNAT superfamily N-acetyltransferase
MSDSLVSTLSIRLARAEELTAVRELEDIAGERYAEAGLPPDLEGLSPAEIRSAYEAELLWVATAGDRLVAFALCFVRPQALHLREVDVHPTWMGQGLGGRLIRHVAQQALARGLPRVTLTTFRDVAWNAPLYRHLGFVELASEAQPDWLRSIRAAEDSGELARWPRVAMACSAVELASPTARQVSRPR